jgi:hypothetical protein
MKIKFVSGFVAAVLGVALAIAVSTHARAITLANSGASAQFIASSGYVEKAVTYAGAAHRSSRRTARRTARRHSYY